MEYTDSRHCHTHKHLYYNNIYFFHGIPFVLFSLISLFLSTTIVRLPYIKQNRTNKKTGQEKKEHPHKTNTYKLFKA